MRPEEKHEVEQTIYKASKINRGLLIVALIFILWNFFGIRALRKSTADMHTKFVSQEISIKANTKQLLDFMGEWQITQQQLADWIAAQRAIQDKISHDNPRVKIPKSPPVPSSLPKPQMAFTPEPRPSPIIIRKTKTKKIYVTPSPKPDLLHELFKKRSKRDTR